MAAAFAIHRVDRSHRRLRRIARRHGIRANDRISKITNAVNAGTTQNFQRDRLG